MAMSWVFYAFLFSCAMVILALTAEHYRGRMLKLLFMMRAGTLLAILPIFLWLPLPTHPVFYIATFGASLCFAYADLIFFGLMSKSGAGVVSRVEPLTTWLVFFVWTALNPALLLSYLASPLQLAGIVVALSGCVYFALRLKNCPVTWPVIKRMLPVIIIAVAGLSLSKTAMNYSDFHSGIWAYMAAQSLLCVCVYLLCFRMKSLPTLGELDVPFQNKGKALLSRHDLVMGACACIGMLSTQSLKYYAITLADNPAYVTVFAFLVPIWLFGIYRLMGRKEEADVVSGFGIVACAFLLVVFTRLIG